MYMYRDGVSIMCVICLSVCLPACLSVCPSVRLSVLHVFTSVCAHLRMCAWTYVCRHACTQASRYVDIAAA